MAWKADPACSPLSQRDVEADPGGYVDRVDGF